VIDVAGNQGEHPMQLEITTTDDGYRLEGELDMATAGGLTELLLTASGDAPLVLDFSGVSFMDSSGLRALLEGAGLPNGGGPVVVQDPSPQVRRVFEITIPDGVPGLEIRP
jgi:anti-sigma B factor antagonist/stage II sporulation protein AA (anti-sigma F factor antagonist)